MFSNSIKKPTLNLEIMKTQLLTLALFGVLIQTPLFAQDRTTVNATSNEISDNLDLRAVASIFGDAKNLQDFERRLNDPENKISNLDLNFDRQVDYLRVIEAVEKNTHLIILQAVLEKDVFQDVATIEVERDRNNQVQIQVVGDVFMYGPNYIYEPVYVHVPVIYNVFWVPNYNPYCSPYYYNYYPNYYYAWTPYPVYRYRRNVHVHINEYNYYNYSNTRRSSHAVALYQGRRSNGYERNYDTYSTRRTNYASANSTTNSTRRNEQAATRNQSLNAPTRNAVENTSTVRTNNVRNNTVSSTTRTNENASTRNNIVQQNNSSELNSSNNLTRNSSNASTKNTFASEIRTPSVRQSSSPTRNNDQMSGSRSSNRTPSNSSTRTRTNSRS